jgi:hypothetical protein
MGIYWLVTVGTVGLLALSVLASKGLRQQVTSEFSRFDRNIAVVALIGIGIGLSSVLPPPGPLDSLFAIFRFALGVALIASGTTMLAVMSYSHWRNGAS